MLQLHKFEKNFAPYEQAIKVRRDDTILQKNFNMSERHYMKSFVSVKHEKSLRPVNSNPQEISLERETI